MPKLINELEQQMQLLCFGSTDPLNPCVVAIQEHLKAGGGRLRAKICMHAGLQLDLDAADAMQLAICCELLHNASLVQDDLLDRTAMRRGSPSVWATYGDSVAVCAGDLMLSSAYAALAALSRGECVPSVLEMVHSRAREVMLGQVVESVRGTKFTDPISIFGRYECLAIGKSASLLSLALELPLLVAGLKDALPLAQATAQSFAVAYQIADDLDDQVEDALEGSLNILSLLQQDGGLNRIQAEHAAATHALAVLAAAISSGMQLPSRCAAVLIASAEGLQTRLGSIRDRLSAPLSAAQ